MSGLKRKSVKRVLERKAKGNKVDRLIYTRWDSRLQKEVVVKRYTSRLAGLREARVMHRYGSNPYLVRYYRFFIKKRKAHIVMEWVRGQSLSALISKLGAFPPRQVAKVALTILQGVRALHKAGYVHGDLHAQNVIVTDINTPHLKIIDFQHSVRRNRSGLARARRRLRNPPAKLAPETRRSLIDKRYDVYGVGFMMLSMMLGKEPSRVSRKKRTGNNEAEKQLWKVIRKAIHPHPARRHRSAKRMEQAIRQIEWPEEETSENVRK